MINPYAKQHLATIDRIIGEIKLSQVHPNWKPQTSLQVRERANSLRSMATTIKMNGGEVKEPYRG